MKSAIAMGFHFLINLFLLAARLGSLPGLSYFKDIAGFKPRLAFFLMYGNGVYNLPRDFFLSFG